ncbi:MazG-like family protein [Desulfitobacterium sp. THU1]|uniref:MazG-like family protein n=1 Tax=Desulfitobacterium sp. THU1 TaxID=3138072 RepID=UPI00311F83E5
MTGGAPVVEVDVVKGLKAIEELKVEMLKAQWEFQEGSMRGSEGEMLQGLADLVALSYLLTRRMGFDYSRLDRILLQRLEEWKENDHQKLETQWGDLSLLLCYLAPED